MVCFLRLDEYIRDLCSVIDCVYADYLKIKGEENASIILFKEAKYFYILQEL